MLIELISLGIFLIVWEIIFLILYKTWYDDDWVLAKIFSGGMTFFLGVVVFSLYELYKTEGLEGLILAIIIITSLPLFFLLNKLIFGSKDSKGGEE